MRALRVHVTPALEGGHELRGQGDHVAHVEESQVVEGGGGVEPRVLDLLEGVGRGGAELGSQVVHGVGGQAGLVVDALEGRASREVGQGLVHADGARALVHAAVLDGHPRIADLAPQSVGHGRGKRARAPWPRGPCSSSRSSDGSPGSARRRRASPGGRSPGRRGREPGARSRRRPRVAPPTQAGGELGEGHEAHVDDARGRGRRRRGPPPTREA